MMCPTFLFNFVGATIGRPFVALSLLGRTCNARPYGTLINQGLLKCLFDAGSTNNGHTEQNIISRFDVSVNDVAEEFAEKLRFYSIAGRTLSKLQGSHTQLLFKHSDKIVIIGKTAEGGNLRNIDL